MKAEKNQCLLSILIPTLQHRAGFLIRIKNELNNQVKRLGVQDEVEILVYKDNRQKTTGYKRNILLQKSKGLFTVFIDDDDMVAEFYIEEILKAITDNPDIDAIGIQGHYSADGSKYEPFETSLKHHWEKVNGWYLRTINHISPVRREHAVSVLFPDKVLGEDYEWTMALKKTGLVQKEVVIGRCMYTYDFVSDKNY
jgi:glycosyltransferase involved in cell wall biosynthesis